MRTYQENVNAIAQAQRNDYMSTILLTLLPLWRASTHFSKATKTLAHLPVGAVNLLPALPLLQNYLKQTYENKLKQSPEYTALKQEITRLNATLPFDITKHNTNIKKQNDLLQRLEKQLIEKENDTKACVAIQTQISKALRSLSSSTQAVEQHEEILKNVNEKQRQLDEIEQLIYARENGFLNKAREFNLQPINQFSNAMMVASLLLSIYSGGATLALQMAVDLGLYYGMTALAEKLVKQGSYWAYQHYPEIFSDILLARVSALTPIAASYASTKISKELNNYIAQMLEASPERIALKSLLSPGKENKHTIKLLKTNPTLIVNLIESGKSLSPDDIKLVDAKNKPITVQTHSGDIHGERAQFHYKSATGKHIRVFASARGIPYVSISETAPLETQPVIPTTESPQSNSLENISSQLLNVGFLSAVYATMGPAALFGAALLSQVTQAVAAAIPEYIQKSVNEHYVNQLQQVYLLAFSKNQTVDVNSVIDTVKTELNLKNYLTTAFPNMTSSQNQYVFDVFIPIINARLDSWQQVTQDFKNMLNNVGIIASDTLPQPIIGSFYNEIDSTIDLVTASATAGMKESPQFYLALSKMINGLNPSTISAGKIYANMVFQPGYINNVLSELKSYAINSADEVEQHLLAALDTQLNDAYNSAVTVLSQEAQIIKKDAIDYVLKNTPLIVQLVESISKVNQVLSKQINNFEKDPAKQLAILTCDIIATKECDSFQRYADILSSTIMTNDEKFSEIIKRLNNKAASIFNLSLGQQLSPATKTAYEKDLESFSVDVAFVSNIAGSIFGSKMAGKIQAVGQVSVSLISILSTTIKMGSVMKDIGTFAAKIMPALAIVNAVLQIFSIFGGGESAAQQTDQMIQQYMQAIEQQLHMIAKMVIDVYKEVGQLGSMMSADFAAVFKYLEMIFRDLAQGQEISQELSAKTQTMIFGLISQTYQEVKSVSYQPFLDAQALNKILAYAKDVTNLAYRNNTLQKNMEAVYFHAEVVSRYPSIRDAFALMQIVNQPSVEENVQRQAEANYLGQTAPENSIAYFQAVAESILSKTFPVIPDMLPWLQGVHEFSATQFRYASEKFLQGVDAMMNTMLKTGMDFVNFALSIRTSPLFWEKIITPYNKTFSNFDSNARAIWENAWKYYVANSQFILQYTQPQEQVKQRLAQKVKDSQQYDQKPMVQIFPGFWQYSPNPYKAPTTYYPLERSLGDILQSVLSHSYLDTVLNAIKQFTPVVGIFPGDDDITSKYPAVASNVGSIKGPAAYFTPIVNTPIEVIQANITGFINDISYSYAFNISAQPHHVDIVGTYYLTQEKRTVTFFQGRFIYSSELTQGIAGRMIMTPETASNLFSPTPPTASSFNCTVQLCAESDLVSDNCIANCITANGWIGPLPFASFENVPYTQPMPSGAMMLVGFSDWTGHANACSCSFYIGDYFKEYSFLLRIYIEKVKEIYQALLIDSLYSFYKNNLTQPLQNTAQWETERKHLESLNAPGLKIISDAFLRTVLANPEIPAYKAIAADIQNIGAAYNVINGFIQLVFGDYTKGTHSAHEKFLCEPINPWKSNGTHFADQHGVQVNAIPGNFTTMHSYFSLQIPHKELRIVWSPFNNAQAKMGLQLGDKTVVAIDPSVNADATYYTRIVQTHSNQYEFTTTLNQFDGIPVKHSKWNTTETQAKLSAFVQSEDATQGIRISSATSLQENTTVEAVPASWNSVNTPNSNQTVFANNSVTFFNTNQSNPNGYSQVATKKEVYVMDSRMYIAWKADAKLYPMTVGINVGQQKGVAEFQMGVDQFNSNTPYYTTITVTQEKITCVTCNKDGDVISNSTQNNNFVTDAAEVAIRISNSTAPDGHQSVSILQPIRVVGFETSVLPKPMSANQWQAENSDIASTPNGLTIVTNPSGDSATLISAKKHILRYEEILMRWKANGDANITLQLSGNPVATFVSPESDQWFYTRVVVFNNTVEITTANEHYDLNSAAVNVTQIDTDAQNAIGTISWVVNSNTGNTANFTLAECMIQDAANTILAKQGAGLISQDGLAYEMLKSAGSPDSSINFTRSERKHTMQLFEILQHTASQPAEIDPDLSRALKTILDVIRIILKNNINSAAFNHNDYPDDRPIDFTRTESLSNTETDSAMSASQEWSMSRSETISKASASQEWSMSRSEKVSESKTEKPTETTTKSKTLSTSNSATETKEEIHPADANFVKTIGVVLGLVSAGVVGAAVFLCVKNRRSAGSFSAFFRPARAGNSEYGGEMAGLVVKPNAAEANV